MPVPLVPIGVAAAGLFHSSSAGSECATMNVWHDEALAGNQHSLDLLVTKAGLAGGGGIAASEGGKNCAKQQLEDLLRTGAITGPHGNGDYGLPPGTPNLLGQYVVAVSPSAANAGGAPVLAGILPTGTALPPWVLLAVAAVLLVLVWMYAAKGGQ